jgi:hypothetical protein
MKTMEFLRQRVYWVSKLGYEILITDYRYLERDDTLAVIELSAAEYLLRQEKILAMDYFMGCQYSPEFAQRGEELTKAVFQRYTLKNAAVGVESGFKRIAFQLYNKFMGYSVRCFDSDSAALAYLISSYV